MTILTIIQNPENEEEKAFSLPVATESVFDDRWKPIIEELGLQWLPLFSSGVDIAEIDLKDVLNELEIFKSGYISKIGEDQVIDRVDLLIKNLPKAFVRKDVMIYIG